jgi:hypothetical protein
MFYFFTISNFLWGVVWGARLGDAPSHAPRRRTGIPHMAQKRLSLDVIWGWLEMLLAYYPR